MHDCLFLKFTNASCVNRVYMGYFHMVSTPYHSWLPSMTDMLSIWLSMSHEVHDEKPSKATSLVSSRSCFIFSISLIRFSVVFCKNRIFLSFSANSWLNLSFRFFFSCTYMMAASCDIFFNCIDLIALYLDLVFEKAVFKCEHVNLFTEV